MLPLLRGATIDSVLSIQNGLMKNDQLAEVFGRERVLGALADTSGELLSSGEALFTRNGNIYIGVPGGASARAMPSTLDPQWCWHGWCARSESWPAGRTRTGGRGDAGSCAATSAAVGPVVAAAEHILPARGGDGPH